MQDLCERFPFGQRDQRMHVIRHDAPREQFVAGPVKIAQCLLDNPGGLFISQQAFPEAPMQFGFQKFMEQCRDFGPQLHQFIEATAVVGVFFKKRDTGFHSLFARKVFLVGGHRQ